ncbi:MAG: BMP family ABC transporter substrate-binding protein [Firmicutes bacterium]|nr:BMP family ABC transporter substrate-binding protein [Bacillota bacterium]
MFKRTVVPGVLILILALLISLAATGADKLRFAMVTDIGGLGDQSFNDAAWDGMQMLKKEYGAEVKVLESKKAEDYIPNLKSLAEQGYDMIWAVGFLMADALNNVAAQYPKIRFGIIDSVVDKPNVTSVTFREEQGSFLVGVVAGKMTKTNLVGFVGGMQFPLIEKFQAGYEAGVKAANPKAKVLVNYVGSFGDPTKGKETALAQFNLGADIVYHAAGDTGTGVIEAAKSMGKGYWAIGVDKDQHHLAPQNVLVCMIKRVDVGVFQGTKAVLAGKGGGVMELSLKEDGVGICKSASKTVPESVLDLVEQYRKDIIAGKIVVPTVPEGKK